MSRQVAEHILAGNKICTIIEYIIQRVANNLHTARKIVYKLFAVNV